MLGSGTDIVWDGTALLERDMTLVTSEDNAELVELAICEVNDALDVDDMLRDTASPNGRSPISIQNKCTLMTSRNEVIQ